VTALGRRDDGRLELRVVETNGTGTELVVEGRTGARTDLRGEPTGEAFNGRLHLHAHEIATISLDD